MKKLSKLVIAFVFIFLITGCGKENVSLSKEKSITCTKTTTDEDGYKTEDKMEITYKDSKITKVKDTNVTETDPEMIDFTYTLMTGFAETFNKINGLNVTYTKEDNNKIKFVMNVDYSNLNVESIKENLGELYNEEESFYGDSDITIDEFKEKYLKEYTCN